MPRRKPKNKILPGQPGNPGRPVGATAKFRVSEKVREAFEKLLEGATPHLEDWLIRTAQKHPDKALDLWVKISERFVPSLQRTEITAKDGEAFAPITINLPAIPKFSIGGAPAELLGKPEEPKKLPESPGTILELSVGEGTPTENAELSQEDAELSQANPTGEESGNIPFSLPPFELSPNILRDMEEIRRGAPADE